jgi:hypothetical protein
MLNHARAYLESGESTYKYLRGAGVTLILVAVGVVAFNYRWLRNVVNGPVQVTQAQLSQAARPDDLPSQWVSFVAGGARDSGLTAKRRREQKVKFLVVPVEGRFLIARVPGDFKGMTYTGYLEVWNSGQNADAVRVIGEVVPGNARDRLLPFHLEGCNDQRAGCCWVLGGTGFLLLLGLFLTAEGIRISVKKAHTPSAAVATRRTTVPQEWVLDDHW